MGTSSTFGLKRDISSLNTSLRPASDDVNGRTLVAITNTVFTVPANKTLALISCTTDFFATVNAVAVLPTASETATGELSPAGFSQLVATDTINIISRVACDVTIAYYNF